MQSRASFRRAASCAALAAVLVAGLSLAAHASLGGGQAPDQGSKFGFEGKITEVASGKLTVNTEDNIVFQVTYDEKTAIHRKDGTAGSSKDLARGARIKVEGTLTPAGVIEADTIDIE